ncbi:MAG: hypothetical protein IT297_10960 [Anaerolineae bacterium]|jgi:hypothetical protein|nr:hypothetical protein [Anaerolineae bacterium]MCZ7553542.1 hypothetical protein [Anaerolineales bacterium]
MGNRHQSRSEAYDLVRFYYRGFCQATRTTAFKVAHNNYTPVPLDADNYDLVRPNASPMHNPAVNNERVYARRDGVYLIAAHAVWASNATGVRVIYIARNGANIAADRRAALSGYDTAQQVSTMRYLNAGDYVTLYAFQNSGGDLNLLQAAYTPVLSVALVGD